MCLVEFCSTVFCIYTTISITGRIPPQRVEDHVPCVNIYIFSHIPLYAGRNSALGGNSARLSCSPLVSNSLELSGHVTSRARLCWCKLCWLVLPSRLPLRRPRVEEVLALEVEVCAHRIKCAIYGTGWLFRVFFVSRFSAINFYGLNAGTDLR